MREDNWTVTSDVKQLLVSNSRRPSHDRTSVSSGVEEVPPPTYWKPNYDSIATASGVDEIHLLSQEDQVRHSGKGATILGLFGVKGTPRPISIISSHDGVHNLLDQEETSEL
jgi:hypothetical protein